MRVYCITMLRDESSILPCFVDQILEFFDEWLLLDHSSVDSGPAYCRERCGDRVEILRLFASGYPQSEVMTQLARRAFREKAADVVVALDCDEFLRFESRRQFEAFLTDHRRDGMEAILLPWLNLAPEKLDGTDIFHGRFSHREPSEKHGKIILFRDLFERVPLFRVWQGNHGIDCGKNEPARTVQTPATPLLHIPVRSLTQFALKLVNGSQVILNDQTRLSLGQGTHWINLALDDKICGNSDAWVRRVALSYPDLASESELADASPLDFTFPYVHSAYVEPNAETAAAILHLVERQRGAAEDSAPERFNVVDEQGETVIEGPSANGLDRPPAGCPAMPFPLARQTIGERYSELIEPLFSLPVRVPVSAWTGHIPFLFALFHMLRPKSYVELGVYLGASLTAAASAAASYRIPTRLYGIDTWQGDEHSGIYEGDQMYEELRTFMEGTFPSVTLIRSLFSEARPSFRPGSIDVLHIDGLHSYDAVKADFLSWLPAVSENGVVLFHDISEFDRGFGVHRLWAELKLHFTTIEFHHSHGLGVLFLNPNLPAIAPLLELGADEAAFEVYCNLVANIGDALPERMSGTECTILATQLADANARAEQATLQIRALLASSSWRVTALLRALKRWTSRRASD